jgi:low affinity Fe/Cu permease
MGHPLAFILAVFTIVGWGVLGPIFHFSDTWQLVINTATTIVTFLMVFLLQNTQNHDSEAMQLKLDELIRATDAANNALLNIEELSEPELEKVKKRFRKLTGQNGTRGTPAPKEAAHSETGSSRTHRS